MTERFGDIPTDKELLANIRQKFFGSVVEIDEQVEGQRCLGNTYILGLRAGPSVEVSNLCHEMGHFAEREIPKLLKFPASGWGFYLGKFWEVPAMGAWGYEPETDQQVRRESRVWAYQLSMERAFGMDPDPYDLVRSVVYLPAWCYYDSQIDHNNARRIKALASHVDEMSRNEFTYEAFCDAWDRRIEVLKDAEVLT